MPAISCRPRRRDAMWTNACRQWLRFGRIAVHIARGAAKATLRFHHWSAERQAREVTQWSMDALAIFEIRVVVRGTPPPARSVCLLVANHVSWLDIHCILSQTHAVFVAKDEVRHWPIIGQMSARIGTLFLPRRRHHDIGQHVQSLAASLNRGINVGLFPEGTTTDGSRLLPFHSALFEAAVATGTAVQPIAIRYVRSNGTAATEANFTGDMSLIDSIRRLAGRDDVIAELVFLPMIDLNGASRRSLATAAEAAISEHLFGSGLRLEPAAEVAGPNFLRAA